MNRRTFGAALLAIVPLAAVGGLVIAKGQSDAPAEKSCCQGYICPITGDELPCQNCCPLHAEK